MIDQISWQGYEQEMRIKFLNHAFTMHNATKHTLNPRHLGFEKVFPTTEVLKSSSELILSPIQVSLFTLSLPILLNTQRAALNLNSSI